MCDCYKGECKVCKSVIPVHLTDFMTPRKDVEVYCQDHLPEQDARIFILKEDCEYPKGTKFGFRYLTPTAKKYAHGNYPNLGVDWKEVDI